MAFILVIFIVLIANFNRMAELEVALPESDAQGDVDPKALMVTVPAQGPVVIQGKSIALEQVRQELTGLKGRFEKVLLMADQDSSIQRAVKILSDAQAIGFKSVEMRTDYGSRSIMTKGWWLPVVLACVAHAAVTVLPVQLGAPQKKAEPDLTFHLAPSAPSASSRNTAPS